MVSRSSHKSPVGWINLEASDEGIRSLLFSSVPMRAVTGSAESMKHLAHAHKELAAYMKGSRKPFTVPVDLAGTEFQDHVWSQLYQISYGTVITYQELAKRSGHPRAMRAVGSAMRVNPVCILIPCHRVVPSSGGIGKYNGGEKRKQWLLDHERN